VSVLTIVLVVLLVLILLGGGIGYPVSYREWGSGGYSLVGLLVVVLLILLLVRWL
jgi:hypothetical protein